MSISKITRTFAILISFSVLSACAIDRYNLSRWPSSDTRTFERNKKIIKALSDGTFQHEKTLVIANIRYKDNFSTDGKNTLEVCINNSEEISIKNPQLRCTDKIRMRSRTEEKDPWQFFLVDRKKIRFDAYSYHQPRPESEKTLLHYFLDGSETVKDTYFSLNNPSVAKVSGTSNIYYVGKFTLNALEDRKTKHPVISIEYENDFDAFQNEIKVMKKTGVFAENHLWNKVENIEFRGYDKPIHYRSQTIQTTRKDYR